MVVVPAEAETLIARHELGKPKKVYKPRTISSIIGGLFLIAFACIWIVFSLIATGSPLAPTSLLPFQMPFHPAASTDPTFITLMIVLGIVFPLIGLIFAVAGILNIANALLYRQVRAVLCEHGVVHRGLKKVEVFRWEEVATVLDKVDVHTRTTNDSDGSSRTTRTISHTYTVACKDSRRFVFDQKLGEVEQLGEEIQIAVSLHQKSATV